MRIDFNAPFNNGKNIFAEIHYNNGKEKEGLAVLDNPSKWPFKTEKHAYILHDKDTLEDGSPKTPHIHFVFVAVEGKSKSNWIDMLAEMFSCPREAVGVQIMGSERMSLRYLLHTDNKEKFQYSVDECKSSPSSWLEEALKEKKNPNPTLEELTACETKAEVYNLVGMKDYAKAIRAWDDLRDEALKETNALYYQEEYYNLRWETIQEIKRIRELINQLDESKIRSEALRRCFSFIRLLKGDDIND